MITYQQHDLQYQHLMEVIEDIYKLLHYKVPIKEEKKIFDYNNKKCNV
jgi:hypothetical protein